jgi:hypothetical protein
VYSNEAATCPSPTGAVVTTDAPVGYIGNSFLGNGELAVIGRKSCPWLIRASHGQKIQLGIIALGSVEATSGDNLQQLAVACPKVVVVETRGSRINHHQQQQHEFNVCIRKTRERMLFTSTGHEIVVYVVALATSDVTSFSVQGFPAETRFMLFYKRE